MEPMQGKLASSQFDFVYTEQFCIPAVISVFFSSCDSFVGDVLEFNQANRGSLIIPILKMRKLRLSEVKGLGLVFLPSQCDI